MSATYGITPVSSRGLLLHLDAGDSKNYLLEEVEVLVVAGGGGGGSHHGGGGGGGGILYYPNYKVTPGTSITVTVGGGGAGGIYNVQNGQQGGNSVFGQLTAIGGGAGANYSSGGGNGGSGGAPNNWSVGAGGGSGTAGPPRQGYSAIANDAQTNFGGGGAGAGSPPRGPAMNSGGNGLPFNISGTLRYYGGGGGAGVYPGYVNDNCYGTGGLGGGGKGGNGPHQGGTTPEPGAPNTGGGGGGVADLYINGAAGGSGIVIVRYPGPQKATGGDTISQVDGYTIHTFSTVGTTTFTPFSSLPTNGSTIYGLYDLSENGIHHRADGSPTYEIIDNVPCINVSANGNGLRDAGRTFRFTHNHTMISWARPLADSQVSNWRTLWRTQPDDHPILIENDSNTIGYYDNNGGGFVSYGLNLGTLGLENKWTMFTIVASNGTTTLYINDGANTGSVLYSAVGTFHDAFGGTAGGGQSWGYVSTAQIYDRSFSLAEVQEHYNATKGRYGL